MSKHKPNLMLATLWSMTHLTTLCISNHQMASFLSFSSVCSNQRFSNFSSAMDVRFGTLSSHCFYGHGLKMNINFCCHFCCSTSMIYSHNSLQCTVISFTWFLFLTTIPLSWWCLPMICACVIITLENAALDTPNKVAFWLQILQLNVHQKSVLFENLRSLTFCSTFI